MNILHLQIPLGDPKIQDNLLIRPELLGRFVKLIQDKLGETYKVIASPFSPSVMITQFEIKESDSFKNFDLINLDIEEFIRLFEERVATNNENI